MLFWRKKPPQSILISPDIRGELLVAPGSQAHHDLLRNLASTKSPPHTRNDICRVTRAIAVGPYPTTFPAEGYGPTYRQVRDLINCLLNVHTIPHGTNWLKLFPNHGHAPITDHRPLKLNPTLTALREMHRLLHTSPDATLYVHCSGGIHRSPAIIMLYLMSLDLPQEMAMNLVKNARPNACPESDEIFPDPRKIKEFADQFSKEVTAFRSKILEI